jgi:hypothetical protein
MNEHPDAEPTPIPARVLLPAPDGPDGRRDPDGHVYWTLTSGQQVYVVDGQVIPEGHARGDLDAYEHDALATLAAVNWARGAL